MVFALPFIDAPAQACNGNGNCDGAPGRVRGAPGAIAGAGLPILAIGYGVFWVIRRRRKTKLTFTTNLFELFVDYPTLKE
ncbi:hypothetical protein IVA98_07495 [Bradyrhizobium sp. 160]|uniref:hypothetical protein n=1 Tax=unclassified Bradyrhizobium TaxID=2631580 RepID=UPI001FF932EA|nr:MULTISPECIES: hypothetical protein [unclassified Bradyrhizobium]MCK1542470.1 hypothetical protein [Bradyrhizobium sp. 179]MCK1623097.1 hypothetical protein [Bradyrhizobium sp. 160]